MADFDCVPVVLVTRENMTDVWPCLVFCLQNSSFVAVDLELSGLGNRRKLNAKSVEDRYKALVEISESRAIISFGLSCFTESPVVAKTVSENSSSNKRYQVQTFNLMCLCSESYMVEPDSLNFLVKHGFDFNKQYSSGLPYYRGKDKATKSENHLRQLFSELLNISRPVVLHNGFVDLVFLYGNLYGSLPSSLAVFLADVQQMFPQGIFDTKYLAEFKERLPASYLEYVFKKRQHSNLEQCKSGRSCIELAFLPYPKTFCIEYCHCKLRSATAENTAQVCKHFAGHGWCSKGDTCRESHNVDDILEAEILKQMKKRKKKSKAENGQLLKGENLTEEMGTASVKMDLCVDDSCMTEKKMAGCHRAGYDAFMTGFIFAAHLTSVKDPDTEMEDLKNKLYLCGKDVPLLIVTSNFTKPSAGHLDKFKTLSFR